MSGYSSPIILHCTFQPISIGTNNKYNIDWKEFDWGVKEKNLLVWTEQVLDVFHELESAVNQNVAKYKTQGLPLEESLTLSEGFCQAKLKKLSKLGALAYRGFFSSEARSILDSRLAAPNPPAPTFVSTLTPFPWEALYQGDDEDTGDPKMFWGLRYSLARILDLRDISKYPPEQNAISNMLFCMHHKLREAYQREWFHIQRLIMVTEEDHMYLLGPMEMAHIKDGKTLLEHLYKSKHNMVHFACHAIQRSRTETDVLLISLINVSDLENISAQCSAPIIELDTDTLTLREGNFFSKPLVFLNACCSGGGTDELRDSYNLPRKFIERGAGAVIATACPIPDVFAAEFARVFYSFFLRGKDPREESPSKIPTRPLPIGEALRRTRLYFVEVHNNPLGLAYGLYSPAHYQVAQPPVAGMKAS